MLAKKPVQICATVFLLSACQITPEKRDRPDLPEVQKSLQEWQSPEQASPVTPPPDIQQALLPPPSVTLKALGPRKPSFDISVNEVEARQFFMSLVDGTPDNMVVHPDVSGTLTLDLKDVNTDDVMATVHDVYGYEYRYAHGAFQVFPVRMRSQVFNVDYLDIEREGGSRTRVSSGQVSQAPSSSNSENNAARGGTTSPGSNTNDPNKSSISSFSGAQVTTKTKADFWDNLHASLKLLIGEEDGRRVITDPLSGTVLVHAMPRELLDVDNYLKKVQVSVNRQVIIEAKIVEVRLNDEFQAGINWTSLLDLKGGSREIASGVFGTGSAAPSNNKTADVTLTPFFSGVALDVTPQIDEGGSITLHVHPAISEVTQDNKRISVTSQSDLNLPLATSTIRESDTIIRATNGQVVVIGGLMQDLIQDNVSSTPFLGDLPGVGYMFRQTRKVSVKTELVILLRPFVVDSKQVWAREVARATRGFENARHLDLP
jgi:MSHA biogenesis protein MshL